jgi:hypothetical protein
MSVFAAVLIAFAAQAPSSGGVAPVDPGGVAPSPSGGVDPTAPAKDDQGRPTMANGMPVRYLGAPDPADMVTPSPAEIAMVVTTTFSIMDQDHSGFIEADEAPVKAEERKIYNRDEQGNVTDTGRTVTVTAEQARAQYLAMIDKNGDGKIDFGEFRAWLAPNIAKNGIPAAWREDIETNYRASAD